MRPLSELTLEELWQLFPIILESHREEWAAWYAEEAELLHRLLPGAAISHIGSTAVRGIWAKPIVDILVETGENTDWTKVRNVLTEAGGYICMAASAQRMSFNKGYTPAGFAERVFHLHLRRAGDHDELYFRDLLNEEAGFAAEYERLKLSLRREYEYDRDGYTAQKCDMVKRLTDIARERYAGRYETE